MPGEAVPEAEDRAHHEGVAAEDLAVADLRHAPQQGRIGDTPRQA